MFSFTILVLDPFINLQLQSLLSHSDGGMVFILDGKGSRKKIFVSCPITKPSTPTPQAYWQHFLGGFFRASKKVIFC